MNYIQFLQQERDSAYNQLHVTEEALSELLAYLSSSKFHGIENDFVHVTTDIFPKLQAIRSASRVVP